MKERSDSETLVSVYRRSREEQYKTKQRCAAPTLVSLVQTSQQYCKNMLNIFDEQFADLCATSQQKEYSVALTKSMLQNARIQKASRRIRTYLVRQLVQEKREQKRLNQLVAQYQDKLLRDQGSIKLLD